MLIELTKARDAAQALSAEADIALIEATASAEALREEARKLSAAVAALNGERPPAVAPKERPKRAKKQEQDENNPLAHVKCSGCGEKGSLREQFMQSAGGAPVRMLVCSCGNQLLQ